MSTNELQPSEGPKSLPPGAPKRNPVISFGLSMLFPGLGQIYNGQAAKALVFALGFIATIYAVVEIEALPYALLIPFVYFYGLVDAYRTTDLLNTGAVASDDEGQESPGWGAALIILGGVILATNLGWLRLASLHRFWPVILIVFGVLFMRKSLTAGKDRGATG